MIKDYYFLSFMAQAVLPAMILVGMGIEGCSKKTFLIAFLLLSTLWLSDGVEVDTTFSHNHTTERTLVSAQPSHTQIEGNIGGSFLFFSGVISEQRMYLLREEVDKGLYKDFTVKHEVFIREDKSLSEKGKFVKIFKCYKHDIKYKYLFFTLLDKVEEECNYLRQEIVVPKGSVIKEISI